MLAVLYAVIHEDEKSVPWDVFHLLLGRTFVFGLRTKNYKT